MLPSLSMARPACRLSCSKRGVLASGGLNTTKRVKSVKVLLASARSRGSYRQSGLIFKDLPSGEDEGGNTLPKSPPGQTLFKFGLSPSKWFQKRKKRKRKEDYSISGRTSATAMKRVVCLVCLKQLQSVSSKCSRVFPSENFIWHKQ